MKIYIVNDNLNLNKAIKGKEAFAREINAQIF